MGFGFWSLVPVIVIIVLALIMKDTFISIFAGVLTGVMMVGHGNPVTAFNTFLGDLYSVLEDETTVWVLLVCALFSSLIMLITESGGAMGFSRLAEKAFTTRKSSMIGTWLLGLIINVDDYLSCLTVGASVRNVTDKNKVSREMLAYIVNATGVTICALVPFSSWAAFMGGLLKKTNMLGGFTVTGAYMHTIPFMVFAWVSILTVPLFVLGKLPLPKGMKKCEERAMQTGELRSPEAIALNGELPDEELKFKDKNCRVINLIAPIVVVAVVTIVSGDLLIGIFAALLCCLILYLPQRVMTLKEFFANIMSGIVDITSILVIIILSYVLIKINNQLGLVNFIIGIGIKSMIPALLPLAVFVVIGLLSLTSGTFWGLAALTFPIAIPLAVKLGVNPFLCAGAIISAVAFGGQVCMYSDTLMLTSASTQVTNTESFTTEIPMVMVSFVASAAIFLLLGFVA